MKAITGIGRAVENKQMKDYFYKIDEKGRTTWLDSEGNQYINGERVITKYNYDLGRIQEVGKISGTVYRIGSLSAEPGDFWSSYFKR